VRGADVRRGDPPSLPLGRASAVKSLSLVALAGPYGPETIDKEGVADGVVVQARTTAAAVADAAAAIQARRVMDARAGGQVASGRPAVVVVVGLPTRRSLNAACCFATRLCAAPEPGPHPSKSRTTRNSRQERASIVKPSAMKVKSRTPN